MTPRKWFALAAVWVVACYADHVSRAGWVYEDDTWLAALSLFVGRMPPLWQTLSQFPNRHLTIWTFYLTPNPHAAHAFNVGLHVLNATVLGFLLERWTDAPRAWWSATLFVVCPMAIEGVAYASGRPEALSLLAILGAVWFAHASFAIDAVRWMGFLLCAGATMFTKPTAVAAFGPLLAWALVMLPTRPLIGVPWLLFRLAPLPIGVAVTRILVRPQDVVNTIPLARWVGIQSWAIVSLTARAEVPSHLSLAHAWWTVPTIVQIMAAAGVLVAYAGLAVVWVRSKGHGGLILFGLGWWLLPWIPRLLVRDTIGWIAEHHAYMALPGLAIAIPALVDHGILTGRGVLARISAVLHVPYDAPFSREKV